MKPLSLLSIILLFIACAEVPADIQKLYDQAMEIHDEVMPRMSEMNKLERRVAKHIEKDGTNSEAMTIVNDLKKADDAMMDWMGQFKSYRKLGKETDPKSYYEGQIESISVVRDLMLTSISNAKTFLKDE